MPRIIVSVIVVTIIVWWVLYIALQKNQDVDYVWEKMREKKKSYVSAEVLAEWIGSLQITHPKILALKEAIHKDIVWMEWFINGIIVTLLCGGHALVEWVPWLAKTKTINTFAQLLWLDFTRIQFTPDMLPSDVTGVDVFNPETRTFETSIWPVVTNILLADEINRTSPKVQSSLLEAMQEKQVTIWWKTVALPDPFFVLATQNPLEQEGTYPLPEAQIDRFLCKILVDYPSLEQEREMLDKSTDTGLPRRRKAPSHSKDTSSLTLTARNDIILSWKELLAMQDDVAVVWVSSSIKDYITRIVQATRKKQPGIMYGSSPRWSIALLQAAQAVAYVQGKEKVSLHDVHMVVVLMLRHRIILSYDAKVSGKNEDIILSEIVQYLPL